MSFNSQYSIASWKFSEMNLSIVSIGFMQITHSFFCLGLEGHNNAGLKTRACQSLSGRVLSLNRQADIGPHLAPQVHPKSSVPIKNKFSFPAIHSMKKEPTSASLPCVIRTSEGYLL